MRVKKLNVNRRHKPGEDEAAIGAATGGDSDEHKWVSPTKPQQEGVISSSNSGSSSPTDVQHSQLQQHFDEHLPLQFQTTNSSEFFVGGRAPVIPSVAAADIKMQKEKVEKNAIRSAMVGKIVEMLQAMKPHAPEKVLAALPRLAQHMEKTLFKMATNEAEYCDYTTLRQRIAHIQENNAKRLLAQQQQMPEQKSNENEAVLTPKLLTEEQARIIFQHLQSWRQKLVNMYGVTPWDILPNATLAKVALYMPSTEQELAVCGVESDKISRFGSSLVHQLQRLRGLSKSPNRVKVKQACKPNLGKRGSLESVVGNSNKKRKNGEVARLAPSPSASLLLSSAPLRPAVDSLPTLLPTVSLMPGGVTSTTTATSSSMAMRQSQYTSAARLSPVQVSQQPFLTRLQSQEQQGSCSPAQVNHMHLLVQGAGQLSKQQNVKNLEHEVKSLRWMLHQSEQEKLRLEQEVQQLRSELRSAHSSK
ncbi:hypothetical protein KXD40_005085 [Peronospora effusa]|uniref:HRDC domain-containing protein n=1 Tax=Peronospora effusa TaxID=542832 RepID=A0A3R7WP01_9STRA|nr:hypothetical protein DD237_005975 [Peronospora effusa]UIZ22239.1 hypothetical protein KXD40_005085 [Peronospora effusa]CAI5710379.1 unnamed protein product [Peronospora effusa]